MTVEKILKKDKKIAINCRNKKQAKKLLKKFDELGYKWNIGKKYTSKTYWDFFGERTCYDNKGSYCNIDWYFKSSYQIIDFELLDDFKLNKQIKNKENE